MKRRAFIANTAIAFIGYNFIIPGASGSSNKPLQKTLSGLFSPDQPGPDEMTIEVLQEQMRTGTNTAEKITKMYLKRIASIDKKGPAINAVIEINPDAEKIARSLDEERKAGKIRGPLHGIPVLLKDNIDTGDRMMTTAGSLALLNHTASGDAFIVKQLRAAGAVILGKTNLTEWANFRSTRAVSGWSSRGGQTKNPFILDRSPCGSSSGSAVAVAANLCAVAVGTETNGSIICPSSMNSVVGIKPTLGLVSRTGIIPIAATQDTAGPMARTVRDAALLLGILVGADPADAITSSANEKGMRDYSQFLDINGLAGKRIGVEKSFLKRHEAIDKLIRKALDQMSSKGAVIIELEFISQFNKIGVEQGKLLQYEFKDGLNKYLATANMPVRSLQDIINYNKQNESRVMPFFKQETFENAQAKGDLGTEEYKLVLAKYEEARKFYNKFFEDNRLDAFCGPSNGFPWCVDLINGDAFTGYGTYGAAAVCGYPSVTVPMGSLNDLPVGISFLGQAWTEPGLISISYAYEQVSKNRIVPKFKKTF